MVVTLVVCALLALPAGWVAGVLFDKVPENLPLTRDLPGVRLGGRYLAMHLVVLAAFLAAGWRFADSSVVVLATYLILFTGLTALGAIDLDCLRLPDRIVVPLLVISAPLIVAGSLLSAQVATGSSGYGEAIRLALFGGIVYFGFLMVFHLIFPGGMGFGDVKVSALLGLYVGWLAPDYAAGFALVMYEMLIGFMLGVIVGFVLFLAYRKSKAYPFGPFLIIGCVIVVLFSNKLVS
jgi:leader peptidase (prepilin peptidase)/N-methyltransferase